MRPLIRWTIGPTHECGIACLKESVRRMRKLYPECDLVICHNQLGEDGLCAVRELGVELYDQNERTDSLPYPPLGGYYVAWKLYPPRLRGGSHEILIDNDIVLTKRVREIDEFLTADDVFLTYEGLHGLHGMYADDVPKGLRVNSGIVGLPPGFDYAGAIRQLARPWQGYFDEQGLVAAVICSRPKFLMIPQPVVPIVEHDFSLEAHDANLSCCGYHFVGANKHDHPPLRRFVARTSAYFL